MDSDTLNELTNQVYCLYRKFQRLDKGIESNQQISETQTETLAFVASLLEEAYKSLEAITE